MAGAIAIGYYVKYIELRRETKIFVVFDFLALSLPFLIEQQGKRGLKKVVAEPKINLLHNFTYDILHVT